MQLAALLPALQSLHAAGSQVRSELGESRERAVATMRALQAELRRVHTLERLRLGDVQELHDLQRRLHLASQVSGATLCTAHP